jgi:hypothetical protein
MEFDIVTTFRNNVEWCDPFFKSLDNTLFNRSKKIILFDNSEEKEKNILIEKIKKFDLNIHYFHQPYDSKSYVPQWIKAVQSSISDKVCFVHSDIVFFMKDWDLMLEEKISKHCVIATGYSGRIRSYFMLADKDVFISTNFGFKRNYDKSKYYEHSGILENREHCSYLFEDCKSLVKNSTFGSFHYIEKLLFFYHNMWSSRSHEGSSCPIPDAEKIHHYRRVSNTKFVASFFNELVDFKDENEIKETLNKVSLDEVQIVFENDFIFDNNKDLLTHIEYSLKKYYSKVYFLNTIDKTNKFVPFIEVKNIDYSKDLESQVVQKLNLFVQKQDEKDGKQWVMH